MPGSVVRPGGPAELSVCRASAARS
jgi:hypothetical protein